MISGEFFGTSEGFLNRGVVMESANFGKISAESSRSSTKFVAYAKAPLDIVVCDGLGQGLGPNRIARCFSDS